MAVKKAAAAPKKPVAKQSAKPGGKKPGSGSKKKKQTLKFHIECKNPVEDGIMNVGEFVSDRLFLIVETRLETSDSFF